jgi:hypothetical protein
MRVVLWGVALVAVLVAATLILLPAATDTDAAVQPPSKGKDELVSFTFEKVQADARAIYRYALAYAPGCFKAGIHRR